jgi:hypothetical protein
MDQIDDMLRRATADELKVLIASKLAAWRDDRKTEIESRPQTGIQSHRLTSAGRAALRLRDALENAKVDVRKHIAIYQEVFHASGNIELVRSSALDELQAKMVQTAHSRFLSARDANMRDASATSDGSVLPEDSRYVLGEAAVSNVILAQMKPLRAIGSIAHSQCKSPDDGTEARGTEIETTGQQLKALMEEAWISQENLADKIGIDAAAVSRHANDKQVPKPSTIGAYENVLGKLLNRKVLINKTTTKRN